MKDLDPNFAADAGDDPLRDPDTVMISTRFDHAVLPELDNEFPDVPREMLRGARWKLVKSGR